MSNVPFQNFNGLAQEVPMVRVPNKPLHIIHRGLILVLYALSKNAEFEPDRVQYSTPKICDRLFLIRAY